MTPQVKDPAQSLAVPLMFSEAVTSVSIAITPRGLVLGGAPLTAVSAIAGPLVTVTLSSGTDLERYDVIVTAEHTASATVRDLSVAVISGAWAMPDGSVGWLTLAEFIGRFGLDETVMATDDNGGGLIDRAFLIGKLADAQAEVEANVAARYALPLVTVPAILKTAIADLARARLYRRGVPDEVADNAKVQRRMLERIAKGDLPLPLPSGQQATPAASDAPMSGWSGSRAYPDNLEGY